MQAPYQLVGQFVLSVTGLKKYDAVLLTAVVLDMLRSASPAAPPLQATLISPTAITPPLRFCTASGVLRPFGKRDVASGASHFVPPVAKPL